ncbi:amidase [Henriciella litoralis]|uniref:amidase n=1 Tax=Henriciella litoralis TaxID=568102 RepID=UPI000A002F87|nr:amidase [Henriciella litoralis]
MQEFSRRSFLRAGTSLAAFLPFATACAPSSVLGATSAATGSMDGIRMAELISTGAVTSSELVEAAIGRAERVEPKINGFATETFAMARKRAETSPTGVFGGVPTVIKDLQKWKGAPTFYGSRAFVDNIAKNDDVFAGRWREMGVVSIGKSTSPEMGLISSTEPVVTGPTRNPWDLNRIPGGSSGGSAALTAARVVPFANASDGGGSIRIPAACCGLFGLKPSRGALISAPSSAPIEISVKHAVTLTVRDSAALFAAAEAPKSDLAKTGRIMGPNKRRLKIAYAPDAPNKATLDAETRSAIEKTADLCRALGHEVIDWKQPVDGLEFQDKFLLFWAAGAAQFVQDASAFSGKPPSPEIVEPWTLGLAQRFLSRQDEFDAAVAYLKAYQTEYASWFDDFDVLLTPTVSTLPPAIGVQSPTGDFDEVMKSVTDFVAFTAPMNVSGAASMNVPIQWTDSGLPVGSMFSGRRGDDGLLLALAYELEAAQPWISRVPDIIKT